VQQGPKPEPRLKGRPAETICSARQTAPGRGRRALAAHWRASGGNRRKEKSCYVGVTGLAGCMLMTRDRLLVVQSCQGHKLTESLAQARMDRKIDE